MDNNLTNNNFEKSVNEGLSSEDFETAKNLVEKEKTLQENLIKTEELVSSRKGEIISNDPELQELLKNREDLRTHLQVTRAEYAIHEKKIEKWFDENLDWGNIPVVGKVLRYVYEGNFKDFEEKNFWVIVNNPKWREYKIDNKDVEFFSGIKVTSPDGISKEVCLGDILDGLNQSGSEPRGMQWGERGNFENEYQIDDEIYVFLQYDGQYVYDNDEKSEMIKFFLEHSDLLEHYTKK
ncbi:hypothetical protein K0B04_03085 [Patescibacteria group bacterium]|nr:hypothetical protein [Patescibacteria group bacterium]